MTMAATAQSGRASDSGEPTRGTLFSRPLLLAWCSWLLASWAINMAIDADGPFSEMSRVPVVRGMLQSMLLGMGLIWPAWRLSQRRHRLIGAETAADLIQLLLIAHITIWPLRLILGWEVVQATLIVATVTITGCAVGMIVWWGRLATTASGRALAMVGCAMVLGGGWVWTWMTGQSGTADWSPMATAWAWCDPDHGVRGAGELGAKLAAIAGVVLVAWAGTLIGTRGYSRRNPDHREALRSGLGDGARGDGEAGAGDSGGPSV